MPRTDIHYLWTDFESDGYLDNHPEHVAVLEAGFVLTDGDLEVLDEYEALIDPREFVLAARTVDAVDELRERAPGVVDRMHITSGLWTALRHRDTVSIADVQTAVRRMVSQHVPATSLLRVAGMGVGPFDLPLVKRLLPEVAARCHYAPLDVSAFRRFFTDVVGRPLPSPLRKDDTAHRSLADCHAAIDLARVYRDHLTTA